MGETPADPELGIVPPDWKIIAVADLAERLKAGGTPKRGVAEFWGGDIRFVKIEDITSSGGQVHRTQEGITTAGLASSSAWIVPEDSVLLSMYASIGEAAINRVPAATNQAIIAIVPNRKIVGEEFLYFALKYHANRLVKFGVQTTQNNINKGIVERFRIPVPSLAEQRAIAHVLRTVQHAKDSTEQVIAATRELKKGLLKHLFTYGPVPVDQADQVPLRETEVGAVPEHWELRLFDELFESQLGKMLSKAARQGDNPRPYMRNANVQWGRIELDDVYEMDFSASERNKFRLVPGDVLICEGGEVGRTAIWRSQLSECYYQKALHRARPRDDRMTPEFLMYHMMNAFLLNNTYGVVGTETTIAHLPGMKLKALPVPVPPRSEQDRIVTALSVIDAKLDIEEANARALDAVFDSLLHHLMTGKLRVGDFAGATDAP